MNSLSIDEHAVAELGELLSLAHDPSGPALSWPFMYRLQAMLGCDELSFNGVDSWAETHYLQQDTQRSEFEDSTSAEPDTEERLFWSHYWSSLGCCHPEVSGDYTTVISRSDFYSVRQWRATGMYADCQAGYDHELLMPLPDGAGRSLRLLAFRGPGTDFGVRERFLLTLLRPHIAEAYRATMRRRNAPADLTPRQRQILDLVKVGYTNRQIARRMNISEGTVRTHLANIFGRLDVTSRTAAVNRISDSSGHVLSG